MAASSSSTPFFGIRDEDGNLNQLKQQQPLPLPLPSVTSSSAPTAVAAANPQAAVPAKKRRNLPGNPNPDAEVIALSPKTLMATNRFICEVCSKGFQREQNLQLHRRGHNLPWKLKQKSTKEVRRRVYLCPEPTCVHHDPSRALGDLTGIKKHFCRKHGEKKWKCDKCSKRYAVQSDWKAHSKTCGTREYRCDCGTLFSRRDSFITHRAFCDALAQESARLPAGLGGIGSHLYGNSNIGLGLSQVSSSHLSSLQQNQTHHPSHDLFRLSAGAGSNMSPTAQFDGLMSPSNPPSFRPPHPPSSAAFFLGSATSGQDFSGDDSQPHQSFLVQNKHFHGIMQLPDLQPNSNTSSSNLFHLGFFPNNGGTSSHAGSNQHAHLMMHDHFNSGDPGGEPPTHGLFSGGNLMNDHMTSGMQALFNTSVQSDHSVIPQMSATALLQKAAQMGATSSNSSGGGAGGGGASLLRGFGNAVANEQSLRSHVENDQNRLQDIMNSFANGNSGIFGEAQEEEGKFGKFNASLCNMDEAGYQQNGLTRDFLGVGSMMRNMGGGMPFDTSEMKSATSSRSFACATFPSVRREE